jgi:dynein heavy chain
MASHEEGHESKQSLCGHDSGAEVAVQRHPRKGHRRSVLHANIAESVKIKQARMKALRERQRSRLDGRHKYIITLVALRVSLTDAEVEDFLLDGNQLDKFDDFFCAHGQRCILLYYQAADTPLTAEMQQIGLTPTPSKALEKRVTVTDGTEFPLTGMCIYFVRPNNSKPVSTSNIVDEVVSGVIDTSDGTSFLHAVRHHLNLVLIPALRQSQKWGPVPQQTVNQFFCSLENYVDFLKKKH